MGKGPRGVEKSVTREQIRAENGGIRGTRAGEVYPSFSSCSGGRRTVDNQKARTVFTTFMY